MTGDPLVDRLLESTRPPPQAAVTADLVDRLLAMPAPDTSTGAPANVRAAVGAAQTPNDRLATMRRFYPDAQPHGSDNFIFNDPRSGRPTLYNPPGMDMGDVASVIPEAGEYLGGIVGGALAAPPAIAGIPATGGASVLAVPAGVGLGAAAGRELATLGANAFGGTVDTRDGGQRVVDATTTAAINAAGGPIVDGVVRLGRWAAGPVRRIGGGTGLATPQDFAEAGVRASAGDVTGNPLTQTAQVATGNTLGGARRYGAFVEGQTDDLGRAVQQTAESIGVPTTPGNAGAAVREGAGRAVERFSERQNALYDRAFALVGEQSRVNFPALQALRGEIAAEVAQAPTSAGRRLQPVLQRIDDLLADAGPDGLAFGAMRRERTALGRTIGTPAVSASAPASDVAPYLQRMYGALTDDMTTHARSAGDDAARALAVADRYTRFNRTQNLPALERVQRQGTDQQVYDMLFPRTGRPDAQTLGRVLRNLEPDERRALAATVLDRMGTPNAGAQAGEDFSAATFMTNWNRLNQAGPAARRALFGDDGTELGRGMDRLARVAASMRDTARYTNWSGTARVGAAIGAAGAIGNEAMQGDVGGVAGMVGLTLVAPAAAARLMTNPRFVNWLASAAPTIARNEASPGLVASLSRIGAVNPEIRDAVEEYRAAITSRPRQQ
jgi:hypothetical protein